MNADLATFRRKNEQIEQYVKSRNYKAALGQLDKRIKKGEKHLHFLKAWKAQVHCEIGDPANTKLSIKEIEELTTITPPVTDLAALEKLDKTIEELDELEKLPEALAKADYWARAAGAQAKDEELQKKWFWKSFKSRDWKSAQKAAMGLQRNFTRERKYYFWATAMCHLISQSPSATEMERKLFGTMAYRFIKEAATKVPTDQKQLLSQPRAINTVQELILLFEICKTDDSRWPEIVAFLESQNLGYESRVAQKDHRLLEMRIEAFENMENWEDAHKWAMEQLHVPEEETNSDKFFLEQDDRATWKLLTKATSALSPENASELWDQTMKFLRSFEKRGIKSMNAKLAELDLLSRKTTAGESEEEIYAAIVSIFESGQKGTAWLENVTPFFLGLSSEKQERLFAHVQECIEKSDAEKQKFRLRRHIIQLRYLLLSSKSGEQPKSTITKFVVECIETVKQCPKLGETSGSDLHMDCQTILLTAALSLAYSSAAEEDERNAAKHNQDKDTRLIQVTALLEYSLKTFEFDYPTILVLIRTYLLLGVGSLAIKHFESLNVKNVQYETIAYVLFTRLSTIHPHQVKTSDDGSLGPDPLAMAQTASSSFHRSAYSSIKNQERSLEWGTYGNLFEEMDIYDKAHRSMSRRVCKHEERRMELMNEGDIGESLSILNEKVLDYRNTSVLPTFEQRKAGHVTLDTSIGPWPQAIWETAMSQNAKVFDIVADSIHDKKLDDKDIPGVKELLQEFPPEEMTQTEIVESEAMLAIFKAIIAISTSKEPQEVLKSTYRHLEKYLSHQISELSKTDKAKCITIGEDETVVGASWTYLHQIYILIEAIHQIRNFTTLLKTVKTTPAPPQSLTTIITTTLETISKSVSDLRTTLAGEGRLGLLLNNILDENESVGMSMKELPAWGEVKDIDVLWETVLGSLKENWDEALDGVFVALKACGRK